MPTQPKYYPEDEDDEYDQQPQFMNTGPRGRQNNLMNQQAQRNFSPNVNVQSQKYLPQPGTVRQ